MLLIMKGEILRHLFNPKLKKCMDLFENFSTLMSSWYSKLGKGGERNKQKDRDRGTRRNVQ